MSEIVGMGLSQYHGSDDEFELLVCLDDGREIGHLVRLEAVKKIAREFSEYAPAPVAALSAQPVVAVPDGWEPTQEQTASACLSYRHDFGLLPAWDREALMRTAQSWLEAWLKVLPAPQPVAWTTTEELAEQVSGWFWKRGSPERSVAIYTAPPADLREENGRLKRAYQGAQDNYQEAVEENERLRQRLTHYIKATIDKNSDLIAAEAHVKALEEDQLEKLSSAFIRGATWYRKNEDFGALLRKAAYDFADYETSPVTLTERAALKGGEACD